LILLCTKPMVAVVLGPVPWLVTVPSIAIIGREITMSAVREWAASQNGKLSEVKLSPSCAFSWICFRKCSFPNPWKWH
jgi:phosphatidylglycerophosphate synthase